MSWPEWKNKQTAELWKGALDEVRAQCAEFNSRFLLPNLEMSGPRWDSPDLEMHWHSAGVDRNIHIRLSGESWPLQLSFSGAAWIDRQPGDRQVSWWKGPGPLSVSDAGELRSTVSSLLPNARLEVESLTPPLQARQAGNSGD